jgi:hypothetical protein
LVLRGFSRIDEADPIAPNPADGPVEQLAFRFGDVYRL